MAELAHVCIFKTLNPEQLEDEPQDSDEEDSFESVKQTKLHRGFLLIFEQLLTLIQSHRQVSLLEQVLSYPHVKHFFRVVTQKIRVKKEGVRGIIYQNLFAAQKLAFKIQFEILKEWNSLRLDTKRAQELADKCIDSSKIKSLETFLKLVNIDNLLP